jgi:energy-coupling factor transporter ATP-binding protein EcfA2
MSVLNKTDDQGRTPRLSEVLFERSNRSFGSLAPLPSNVEAIEAGLRFSAGLNTLVAITGPSGWGKTHLLEAITYRLTHELGTPIEQLSAAALVANPQKGETPGPMILDDVQEILGRPRPQLALRLNLERRVRAGKSTILAFTLPKPNRQLKGFIPNYRDWTVCTMAEPQAAERVLLLNHMSAAESLSLSPGLINVIASSMSGNGRTLSGALKRLRLSGSTWLDARSTLRACGLLDPFFADSPDWDLKLKVLKVAESNRSSFPKVQVSDLALVVMLHEAGLAEAEVARCLSISPADAYLRASRYQKQCATDSITRAYVQQLVSLVVDSLQSL